MKQIRCIKDIDSHLIPIDKIESINQYWVSAGGSRHDISYDTYEILLKIFEEVKLEDMDLDGSKNPVPELKESEDERIKTFIRGLLLPHIADSHIEGDKIVYNKDIDNYRKALAWLERQGKQKPAEWSEEDETIKKNISHIIRQYDKISKRNNQPCWYVGDCLLWMQNIKERMQPQPKQVWSKEDEDMLQFAIEHFEIEKRNSFEGGLRRKSMQEFIDWFKSLRPQSHWKPTEEQMDALKSQLPIIKGSGDKVQTLLESLYNDLKKL